MKSFINNLKQGRIKKRYIVIAFFVISGILLFIFFGKRAQQLELVTYKIERVDVSDTLRLAGTIDVEKRVDLGFARSGRVRRLTIEEGDEVREDQVLAEIDQNSLQAQLIQARSQQIVVETDTQSDTDSARIDLATIQAQQDAFVSGAYEEYISGDLQAYLYEESSRALQTPIISGTYNGQEEGFYVLEFYRSGAYSGFSFRISGLEDGTHTAFNFQPGPLGTRGLFVQIPPGSQYHNTSWIVPVPNTRSATYVSRKAAYDNALKTRDQQIAQAENQLNRVTAASQNVARSTAQQQEARAAVNSISAQLSDGLIRAPFAGIVAKSNIEIGEIVNAFEPLITLFGSNEREFVVNVPEIYINKIEEGDQVKVTLDAYPDEMFQGVVREIDIIDTEVDGVPVYETHVTILEQDPRIRVGMNAKAEIISDQRDQVLAVPGHYIIYDEEENPYIITQKQQSNEGDHVIQVNGNGLANLNGSMQLFATPVTLGFEGNDGFVEVIDGATEGLSIVRPEERWTVGYLVKFIELTE